jgi:hypothetical protein
MVSGGKKNVSLSPAQGRPAKGCGSSFDLNLCNRIIHYRKLYADWGAKMIVNELIQMDGYSADQLPCLRTIERFLKSKHLTKNYQKNVPLPHDKPQKVGQAHQCWQMDDKGPEPYRGVGYVGMINVKDVFSHVYVGSCGINLPHTRSHPNTTDYQYALRTAFTEFGLPQMIQADHGSNFYENRSKSPFPTPLHLWLLGLGIDLVWANAYRPTDQAVVERSHQITHWQNDRNLDYKNMQDFQEHINRRRQQLNHNITCDTWGKAPLKAFPEAIHSKRFYNPLTENILFATNKIDQYLSNKKWFRKVSQNHTLSLGGQVYYLPKAKECSELTITFDEKTRNLIFHDDKEQLASLEIKGIDFQNLAGINYINRLTNQQLLIPMNWEAIKINTTFCPNN